MTFYNGLIGLFWLIFIVVWLFSYLGSPKSPGTSGKKNMGWQLLAIAVIFFILRSQIFYWLSPIDAVIEGNPAIHLLGVLLCGGGMLYALWHKFYLRKKWSSRVVLAGIATAVAGSVLASTVAWLLVLGLLYYYFYK